MLPTLSPNIVSFITLIGVAVLCVAMFVKSSEAQGFKKAVGTACKNRRVKTERMQALEAVIDESLADPNYREQTLTLLNTKAGAAPPPAAKTPAS